MPLTRSQLENPGDLWATIAKSILTSDATAWPTPVYAHRESDASNTARTDIEAYGFGRASDHMDFANVSGNSTPFYNHRTGRLAFAVITPVAYRSEAANANVHANCVGRIGNLCDRTSQKFTAAACENLVVINLVDMGVGAGDPEDKTDTDRTMREFEITYLIPAAVYAAAA
jgi:hypothetical protein